MDFEGLKNISLVRRCAICLGLAQFARAIKKMAAGKGGELKFGWFSTTLHVGDYAILFPPGTTLRALDYIDGMNFFRTRAFFKSVDGVNLADCRRPAEYRLPSGGRVWLPAAAEAVDIFRGIFCRARPFWRNFCHSAPV